MPDWPSDIGWEQVTTEYFQDSFHADEDMLGALDGDDRLHDLFDTAFFDMDASHEERMDARDEVREYMMDEYGLDIDEVFDWQQWRDDY